MRAYSEEGLSIVEVLPEPKYKLYNIIDKGWFVILPLIVIVLIFHKYLPNFVAISLGVLLIIYVLFYFLYVQIGNLFRSENIAYKTIGKLHFKLEFIELLNNQIDLTEINSIEISSFDYEGKSRFTTHLYNPTISLGIYNFIRIRFKNGNEEKCQFKLMYDTQLYNFRQELVHYYKLGLIRELNLHDILGNHSFESKKDFRKHNPKYTNYPS